VVYTGIRTSPLSSLNVNTCYICLPRVITTVPSLPLMPCRMGIPFEWTGAGNRPIKLINLDKEDFKKRFEIVPEIPRDLFGERTAGAPRSEMTGHDKRLLSGIRVAGITWQYI
jgi:hypothetical protein